MPACYCLRYIDQVRRLCVLVTAVDIIAFVLVPFTPVHLFRKQSCLARRRDGSKSQNLIRSGTFLSACLFRRIARRKQSQPAPLPLCCFQTAYSNLSIDTRYRERLISVFPLSISSNFIAQPAAGIFATFLSCILLPRRVACKSPRNRSSLFAFGGACAGACSSA